MTPIGPVTRPHPTLPEYYDDETQRRQYVRRIFDETAVDYDRIERILGIGKRRQIEMRGLHSFCSGGCHV